MGTITAMPLARINVRKKNKTKHEAAAVASSLTLCHFAIFIFMTLILAASSSWLFSFKGTAPMRRTGPHMHLPALR